MKRKKYLLASLLASLVALSLLLSACGKIDYTPYVSEWRSDLFYVETEEYSLTLACVEREHPYAMDGVVCTVTKRVEMTLTDKNHQGDYSVTAEYADKKIGGEMSYRNLRGDNYFSQGVDSFPEGSVKFTVSHGGKTEDMVANSVRTSDTMSKEQILNCAVEQEKTLVGNLTKDGVFEGEFYVRLLKRDILYYFVGIIGKDGSCTSLLLNAQTGEQVARRSSDQ